MDNIIWIIPHPLPSPLRDRSVSTGYMLVQVTSHSTSRLLGLWQWLLDPLQRPDAIPCAELPNMLQRRLLACLVVGARARVHPVEGEL
jgi:hypothetical protein